MRRVLAMSVVIVATSVPAVAQQRPFLFSVTTAEAPKPAVRFDYDVGVGERAFQSDTANQPEQRVGVQASRGRLTFLARFGIAEVGSSYQSSQSGEALYSILAPANRVALAAGGGMLHEADGVNVLLVCFVGGINTAESRAVRQSALSETAVVRARRIRSDHERGLGPQALSRRVAGCRSHRRGPRGFLGFGRG